MAKQDFKKFDSLLASNQGFNETSCNYAHKFVSKIIEDTLNESETRSSIDQRFSVLMEKCMKEVITEILAI